MGRTVCHLPRSSYTDPLPYPSLHSNIITGKNTQQMDIINAITNPEEPEWLEKDVIGGWRVWQILFLSLAGLTALTVMICCCFRFRIPRTKQQIEANYQRRQITAKFRQQLQTIHDSKMDTMSLNDALALIYEKTKSEMDVEKQQEGSQDSSVMSPQQNYFEGTQMEGGQKPEPQVSGMSFVKFATKVAHVSKLAQPRSPSSPTPSSLTNKIDF